MEVCGFLAGAPVRFATHATHKNPPPVLGADGGTVYLLSHGTYNYGAASVFPRTAIQPLQRCQVVFLRTAAEQEANPI
jgi:hypothetical protein